MSTMMATNDQFEAVSAFPTLTQTAGVVCGAQRWLLAPASSAQRERGASGSDFFSLEKSGFIPDRKTLSWQKSQILGNTGLGNGPQCCRWTYPSSHIASSFKRPGVQLKDARFATRTIFRLPKKLAPATDI